MSQLESHLESITEAPRATSSFKAILKLIERFERAAGNPSGLNATWLTEVPVSAHAVLQKCFGLKADEAEGVWAKDATNSSLLTDAKRLELMGEAKEIIECIMLSLEEDEGAEDANIGEEPGGIKGKDNSDGNCRNSSEANGSSSSSANKRKSPADGAPGSNNKSSPNNRDNSHAESQDLDDDEAELQAALAMSLGDGSVVPQVKKQRRQKSPNNNGGKVMVDKDGKPLTDEEIAKRMARGENDDSASEDGGEGGEKTREAVEFQRYDDKNVVVSFALSDEGGDLNGNSQVKQKLDEINSLQAAVGEPYVDPQFPALDSSLYLDPEDAKTWTCGSCGKRNALPPLFAPPTSAEEARDLQAKLDSVKCRHCLAKPTNVSQVRFVHRPSAWLRPAPDRSRDPVTEMLFPSVTDVSIKSKLCVGYIRDDMGNTLGSDWAVIRSEVRPEDVVQGAIGIILFFTNMRLFWTQNSWADVSLRVV